MSLAAVLGDGFEGGWGVSSHRNPPEREPPRVRSAVREDGRPEPAQWASVPIDRSVAPWRPASDLANLGFTSHRSQVPSMVPGRSS